MVERNPRHMPEDTGKPNSQRLGGDARFLNPTDTYPNQQRVQEQLPPSQPPPDNPDIRFAQGDFLVTPEKQRRKPRTIIVSNRLPLNARRVNGTIELVPSVGGMAIAMNQYLQAEGGDPHDAMWLGYMQVTGPGQIESEKEALESAFTKLADEHIQPFRGKEVHVPKDIYDLYYGGFANDELWPRFHRMPNRSSYYERRLKPLEADTPPEKVAAYHQALLHREQTRAKREEAWIAYKKANEIFAQSTIDNAGEESVIDVQDYQLLLVGKNLREKGFTGKTKFFLHIPFPPADEFDQVAHAREIAEAMLSYNEVGFQTLKDRQNFLSYVQKYLPDKVHGEVTIPEDADIPVMLNSEAGRTIVGTYPISIDPEGFAEYAKDPETKWVTDMIKEKYKDKTVFYSAGRRDYIKGFVESLQAYKTLLRASRDIEKNKQYIEEQLKNDPNAEIPDLIKNLQEDVRKKVVFILAASPSRETIEAYHKYGEQVKKLVRDINEEFGDEEWTPVEFLEEELPQWEIAALANTGNGVWRSRADGMNLMILEQAIANETLLEEEETPQFIPTQIVGSGAGAHETTTEAIIVDSNPYARYESANAMLQVINMSRDEKADRLIENTARIHTNTVVDWARKRNKDLEELLAA